MKTMPKYISRYIFLLQIFILQCDSITMQKCRVLCVNVAIVMNEKHNNRSGNSFRAHHRSSKIFIRSIWQDLQMQYEILIKERWACEMKKKNQPFNGERGESNYCHSNFFCKFINMQLYIVDIESSVFCVRLSTFVFSPFFSINEIELQHSDTYDSMNWCFLVFILPLYFALWMNYNGD